MKIKDVNAKAAVIRTLSILFLLLYVMNTNGQQEADCKTKLDSYNNISPFPESKITEYKNCLAIIENYFYSIDPGVQKNTDHIKKLNSELKSKNNLNSRRATKTDSLNYRKLEETTNADIKSLTESNKMLLDQKNKYRASLEKSFDTIINYYISIESSDNHIYEKKLKKLNAYR